MAEDRDFEIFADDLFRHVLAKRLSIQYGNQIKRAPGEHVSNFNTIIEIPLIILGESLQSNYFLYFFHQDVLEVYNPKSVSRYYSKYVEVLLSIDEWDVFDKLFVLASVTVELGAYCFLQGNREIVYYAPRLYFSAFQHFKKDFFDNGGWDTIALLIEQEYLLYEKSSCKNPLEAYKSGEWSDLTVRRVLLLSRTAILFAIKLHDGNTDYAYAAFILNVGYKLRAAKVQCTKSIDCPETKAWKVLHDQIIFIFKRFITDDKSESNKQISSIIENKANADRLLRYCYFIRLVASFILGDILPENTDTLHFVKLLLKDMPRVAYFCIDTMQPIRAMMKIRKDSKTSEEYFARLNLYASSTGLKLMEAKSDVTPSEQVSSNKRDATSVHESRKILLSRFIDEIAPKNKPCASPLVRLILAYLSNEDISTMLLNCDLFRRVMSMRVAFPKNHFGDPWLLIVTQLLICCLQPFKNESTEIDNATETNSYGIESSTNCTSPKLIELSQNTVPTIVTQTTKPSISYSHETFETEITECNNENVETGQLSTCSTSSHETDKAEIVERSNLYMKTMHTPVSHTSSQETSKTEVVEGDGLSLETTHALNHSSQETFKTEIVEGSDLNRETTHALIPSSQETDKTEIVEGGDLNEKTSDALIHSSHETVITKVVEDDDLNMETTHTMILSGHETVISEIVEIDN